MKSIRVASYNIRKAIGTDRRRIPERVIDVLNEVDADIIALQEADRRFGVRSAALPPLLLDSQSGYKAVPLNVQTDSMGWHGNAILVRKDAQVAAHDVIHLPCLEPRGATMAEVTLNGATMRVFGMHLDLSGLWRRRQASAMIHAAAQGEALPTVLMGDLNEWSAERGCLADFARHYSFAPCGRSFHARRPVARLDRIMHCGRLKLMDSGVHESAAARKASDHLPIWAEFALG
ncbi:endonuclease/exonuclease/phosphatase family metal-dependent hydrolase [Sphingobium wenxiniae]|jgi:endonuclease/exonuclease/phosphatase family metal-dependent hydrolase|uniref:Endonuclease n=2 Tax=Sphingobium TaxID=165695 RepID=T0G9B3_9SPHN|nr:MULTISPECIES: endonuclease/exonuclease/phosphatase family protein [Sphingobium]EQA96642.1 endonuclease [Sphingobium baderi LL03]MBB6190412.1 endonuclease/exonuclease/phosphatase family metal-dependent hydrolase [Sphingobium wenxiniae]TWH95130.1 endonuclease/exonuclease/phosphatase family metal-dependent hydrolase [Sphingobium wenxiniae]WRD74943.1 endonuclease/exonuclease/phosphatase family protein [Sphingobium baderi]